MGKYTIEPINPDYDKKYNVLHGASFASITAYQEQANIAVTALISNLDGLKGALGREETWDDTTCSKLVESFDTSTTEINNAMAAIDGKCPGAVGALEALKSALDEYKTAYDAYVEAATSYGHTEGGEPEPKTQTQNTYDDNGKVTGTTQVETYYHKQWSAELAKKDGIASAALEALNTAEAAVPGAISAAKGALS